jgi:hypothetical protein
LLANVRWLAGYRHPRHRLPDVADALHVAFADPALQFGGVQPPCDTETAK